MDVTCERCHTEYEFDDALVSDQGTSVRCTQCGHRFKVKRRDAAAPAAPEVWIVRTVDGQALEFRALRELKTAISSGKVGRDDVLSRGAGRPRRLASIAELEPFFVSMTTSPGGMTNVGLGAVESARARSATPAGLGPFRERNEQSVAIPLPTGPSSERRAPVSVNVPPPTPPRGESAGPVTGFEEDEVTHNRQYTRELFTLGAETAPPSVEPVTLMERDPFPDSGPATIVGVSPVATSPGASTARHTPPRGQRPPVPVTLGSESKGSGPSSAGRAGMARTVGYGTPAASDASGRSGAMPAVAEVRAPKSAVIDTIVDFAERPGAVEAVKAPSPAAAPPAKAPAPVSTRAEVEPITQPKPAVTPAPPPAPPPPAPPPPAPEPIAQVERAEPNERAQVLPPEPPPGAVPPPPTPAPIRAQSASDDDIETEGVETPRKKSKQKHRVSLVTPPPPDTRYSVMHDEIDVLPSDRRGSILSSRRSSGSMKLIVVLLTGGLALFGGVVLWQRHVRNAAQEKVSEDPRLAGFLDGGEKALREGDFEGAHEQFLKASALGERDPRVTKALARLATLRAEVPWLELLLLPSDDPGRAAVQARYQEMAAQAKSAAERAREIAPDDPEVARVRIDVHRILGEVDRARGLVDHVTALESQPDTMLSKAALDLSEQRKPSESVIDRLTQCASQEGNAGRARVLLVYALARSGDVKRARVELAPLEKLPKVHPLLAELQRFVDRAEKGEDVALRVEDLPSIEASASATTTPATSSSAAEGSTSTLQQAQDALSRGDHTKAEQLFEKVLAGDKNNLQALMGRAAVALRQGQGKLAQSYYQRAVDANPTNSQALVSLADMKWSGGEQGAAKGLYRRALDNGLSGDAATRARERASGGTSSVEPPPFTPTNQPTATTSEPTATTPPPPPPPPPTSTSDVPPWDGDSTGNGGPLSLE
ncbi:MAG: tetratricopeptide repeat protein [Polyangiaceae bacterium]|nr:tetratricopeptide repeat protein [Polyangiaceae bacterium]